MRQIEPPVNPNATLPPKAERGKLHRNRGRNEPNTFGVSRAERDRVLSHKYFSPPTGSYFVKYNCLDAKDKITYFVPEKSSPERDPRFNYARKDTLLWVPYKHEHDTQEACGPMCQKCQRRQEFGSLAGSLEGSPLRGNSKDS